MSRRTSGALARLDAGRFSDRKDSRALRPNALAELRTRTAEVLGDHGLNETAIGRAAEELHGLAHDAEALATRMLQAGRRLLRLQRDLGHGATRALMRAGLVPFGEAMASKLRAVAEAVEDQRIPEAAMPRALTAAYAAARLPAPEAARLIETGVVRPDATEREVRDAIPAKVDGENDPLSPSRRKFLERQRERLLARVREIEALLGQGSGSARDRER